MDRWTENKDAILAIVAVLGVIGAIAGAVWATIKWGFLRLWQRGLRVDVKVFEVITDPAVLLLKLYATENDNSPLADHNVKYQPRDPNRDLQAELKAAISRSRYLLITAPTGYGKTREAGVLAQTMMLEGWRVLRIKNTGWLDIPRTLPTELNNNRSRVLIFLDDLNGLFSTGERTESPRAGQIPMLSEPSYHDRLLHVLNMLEGMCTEKEIRVIATARSEADQWSLLNFNPRDRLWRRFERIELSGPIDTTVISLLTDSAKQVDLRANPEDFAAIARKSDGTYRNILLNLRRWHAQNKEINKDDFTETLDGSWRDIYERAVKKHPPVEHVYDAIDILQQVGIWPFGFIVEQTALAIWGGNTFQKLVRRRGIQLALDYLTDQTKILRKTKGEFGEFNLSDGQIEAKGTKIHWSKYILDLEETFLDLKKQPIGDINPLVSYLLFQLGLKCLLNGSKEHTMRIWRKIPVDNLYSWFSEIFSLQLKGYPGAKSTLCHAVEQKSQSYLLYFSTGILLEIFDHAAEAEDLYRQIISKDPHDAYALARLGDVLREQQRYPEAEDAYCQAIASDPNHAYAYSRLGSLLRVLKRYSEAEDAYSKAIIKNPNDAFTYWRFATLLTILERYAEAEENYRQAINNDFDKVYTSIVYSDLGITLMKQERYVEAEAACRIAIDLNPSEANAHSNLGKILMGLNRYEEAAAAYRKAIELNRSDAAAYNSLGILLRNLKLYDEAEAAYHKAIELNPSYTTAYYNLIVLLRMHGQAEKALPLLQKMIKINPEDFSPYLGIASITKTLGESIPYELVERAHRFLPEGDFYNKACLESVCDNTDVAFEHLRKATQQKKFNPSWAWEDPDLEWIRNDPRFLEIVGPRPENLEA